MFSSRRRVAVAGAVIVLTLAAWPSGAERRAITEKDLFKFVWVADPQIAPEGSRVAFVRVIVNEKRDQYDTTIWLARTDGREAPRRLTNGTRDSGPRWSPDGRRLAFVRSLERDGRPQASQIAVMAMDGGEARTITEIPRGANFPAWSPDGRAIAFMASATPADLATTETRDNNAQDHEKPRQSDVRVISRAAYRANGMPGSGYVDLDRPSHVWTVAVPDANSPLPKPKQATSGEFGANEFRWSPDGSRLFFTADRRHESYYYPDDSDLWAVSKDGGEPVRIASIEGSIGSFTPSADGKRIAFVGTLHGNPERSYSQPDLFVVDLPDGTPRNSRTSFNGLPPAATSSSSAAANGDDSVPERESRALPLGPAVAPRRTPPAHRRVVRQMAAGETRGDLRESLGGTTPLPQRSDTSPIQNRFRRSAVSTSYLRTNVSLPSPPTRYTARLAGTVLTLSVPFSRTLIAF